MAKATVKIKLDTRKLDALVEAMRALSSQRVKVGVLGAAGSENVVKAVANEFGTADIPERSFLRATFNAQRAAYVNALRRAVDAIVMRRMTPQQALGLLGVRVVADVQQTITEIDTPPLAPSTVAAKGSTQPLIDTGRLRASIAFEVVPATTVRDEGGAK